MERGNQNKALRNSKGWSQEELADRAGLSESYVRHLESGRRPPTSNVIEKLGQALGVDLRTDQERASSLVGTHEIVKVPPKKRSELEAMAEALVAREFPTVIELGLPLPITSLFASLPAVSERSGVPVPVEVDTFDNKIEGMTWCVEASGPIFCQVRADIFEAAAKGNPQARWSVAHECAHPLLHHKSLLADPGAMFRDTFAPKPFERAVSSALKIFEVGDWQANAWAAAILISVGALRSYLRHQAELGNEVQVDDIARHFQVSPAAAEYRMRTALPALGGL